MKIDLGPPPGPLKSLHFLRRDVEHVEDFVLTLQAHISDQFQLPVYIIDCGVMTDVCVEEPFLVQILPCIKYFGESIQTYTGDFEVDRLEYWLQVFIFKTKVGIYMHFQGC